MRRRGKPDGNQAEIVEAYRGVGASVLSLAGLGDDAPDLLVGFRLNYLVEVKNPDGRDRLSDGQKVFHATWRGWPVAVVRTTEEALDVIGIKTGER